LKLSDQQREWFEAACARIDPERLKRLVYDLTAIHSPTGAERAAAEYLADYMRRNGFDARCQVIDAASGNCIGRVRGGGDGPTLMLYAPIDTHLDADAAVDVPWVGPRLRADMLPQAEIRGDLVLGLGASNPKSMIATLTEAATAVIDAGVPLKGDVLVASCGGGMPWVVPERGNAGISSGVMHMLSHGVTADFGVIFKPWDEVYYEHAGMVWFKVTTWGTMGYSGIPRGIPEFRSSIVPAARVILELEQWLTEYPNRHASAQVRPEGWIAAVRAGWPDKPAFPSAACEIYLDLRTNPDQTMAEVQAEFDAVMRGIVARYEDVDATWEMIVSCRSSRTDPDHWVVRSATRAWEEVHGRSYPGAPPMSGQTDAAAICQLGIPLVRLGYPSIGDVAVPEEFRDGLGGMGVANIPDLIDPCRAIIYTIIDSCTRTRGEVGLKAF
jgi:acetylornithine deacetylase/succinyl-diaminopimelate desuccinylase-like protein